MENSENVPNKNKGLLIVIAILVVIVLGMGGYILLNQNNSGNDNNTNSNLNSNTKKNTDVTELTGKYSYQLSGCDPYPNNETYFEFKENNKVDYYYATCWGEPGLVTTDYKIENNVIKITGTYFEGQLTDAENEIFTIEIAIIDKDTIKVINTDHEYITDDDAFINMLFKRK